MLNSSDKRFFGLMASKIAICLLVRITATTVFASEPAYCVLPKYGTAAEKSIPFPGAQTGARLVVSNMDLSEVSAIFGLEHALAQSGDDLIVRGFVVEKEFMGKQEAVDCVRLSIQADDALSIKYLNPDTKSLIPPKIESIICICAINPDGSKAFLNNAPKSMNRLLVSLKQGVAPATPMGGAIEAFDKRLASIAIPTLNIASPEPDVFKTALEANIFDKDLTFTVFSIAKPAEVKKVKDETLDDELGESLEGFGKGGTKKQSALKLSKGSLKSCLNSYSSQTGARCQPAFWGGIVIFPKEQKLQASAFTVVRKKDSIATIQCVANPGYIVEVELSQTTPIQDPSLAMNAGEGDGGTVFYYGKARTMADMETLLESLRAGEATIRPIDKSALLNIWNQSGGASKDSRSKDSQDGGATFSPGGKASAGAHRKSSGKGRSSTTQEDRSDLLSGSGPVSKLGEESTSVAVKTLLIKRADIDKAMSGIRSLSALLESVKSGVTIQVACPACKGVGHRDDSKCGACNGIGRLSPEKSLKESQKR